jgi:hypothetical protein
MGMLARNSEIPSFSIVFLHEEPAQRIITDFENSCRV